MPASVVNGQQRLAASDWRAALADFPPCDGRRIDAQECGGRLLGEPQADADLVEAAAGRGGRLPGAVAKEEGNRGDVPDLRGALPPLPVEECQRGDADFVGNFSLEAPPKDALPTDVFPPGPGLVREHLM